MTKKTRKAKMKSIKKNKLVIQKRVSSAFQTPSVSSLEGKCPHCYLPPSIRKRTRPRRNCSEHEADIRQPFPKKPVPIVECATPSRFSLHCHYFLRRNESSLALRLNVARRRKDQCWAFGPPRKTRDSRKWLLDPGPQWRHQPATGRTGCHLTKGGGVLGGIVPFRSIPQQQDIALFSSEII